MEAPRVWLGNRVLLERRPDLVQGRRLGLITNQSGVTSDLTLTADVLRRREDMKLRALFAPEHGISGDIRGGAHIDNTMYPGTDLPVFSLYGSTRKPTPEMLQDLDLLLFDIQDVGVRFYTYISTMAYAMQAAAECGVDFIVLDRPNPLSDILEGNLLDPAFASFVGVYPILLRHGLTAGELAGMFNAEYSIGARLTVISMQGWRRTMFFDETGLRWVQPSPNLRSLGAALAYPGTCLLEGTNVSAGRGTDKPFEQVGAPFVNGQSLADTLNSRELEGVRFEAVTFVPNGAKHAGEVCQGIEIQITDRRRFRPVRVGLEIIVALRRLFPDDFAWREPANAQQAYHFDLLMGTAQVRRAIESGASACDIVAGWNADQQDFEELRTDHLLYE